MLQALTLAVGFVAMPGQPVEVAASPASYATVTKNASAEAACSHMALFQRIVCLAAASQPIQFAVPDGANACPNSGPGVACGLSDARDPDPGAASTPPGMTPCATGANALLPKTPAACPNGALDPFAQTTAPAGVQPSVPIASQKAAPKHVQLTVDGATRMPGHTALLTAATDKSVTGTGQAIEIFDMSTGRLAGACSAGSQCVVAYAANAGKHSFEAFASAPTPKAPSGKSGVASPVVSVSWIAVTMVADRSSVGPGRSLTLTMTSTIAVDKTGWLLQLYDAATHTRFTYCSSGNTCRTTITQTSAGGRGFVAVLAPPSATAPAADSVVAQTDVVQVSWLSVAVSAFTNSSKPGGVVHVTATVNADLKNSGWSLGIYDNHGQLIAPMCNTGSSCTRDVSITGAMPSFSAAVGKLTSSHGQAGQLGKPDGIWLTNLQATSPQVTPVVHSSQILWGVDSCTSFTDGAYPSVVNKLGTPDFWGRYLTNTVCPGISGDEVNSARKLKMGILPIYNDYNCSSVVGYDTGHQYAAAAAAAARALGIPSGVALAVDIEPPGAACPGAGNVDGAFVQGWHDGVIGAGYVPAYYGNGGAGTAFASAYCTAVTAHPEIANNSHVWTFEASLSGGYSKSNRPDWSFAYSTQCPEHGTAWQYMLSGGSDPNVDQDMLSSDFPLWYP